MNNKLFCNPARQPRATELLNAVLVLALLVGVCLAAPRASAGDAPPWMRALVNAPLPEHDDKTDAVLLYAEDVLNVQANGKIKSVERRAYKILRPDGKGYGTLHATFDAETKITNIHGWCIPAQGKAYEVKDKDSIETALFGVANGELVTDIRTKLLQIPAADPGNIVGFEIEHEDRPYVLQDEWVFQESIPVREAHYSLQLPAGWSYKASWLNHAEVAPAPAGSNQWQWVVSDVKAIRHEKLMPSWRAVAAQMIVSLFPADTGTRNKGFQNWREAGSWEFGLMHGRRQATPEIQQKVAALTVSASTPLAKMRALARFVQRDIRYVAIELGIGGWQPHPAADVFAHRYGDCKDKATLLGSMLQVIGVESFNVAINPRRGSITPQTPAHMGGFGHVILAIKLPDGVEDPSLVAVVNHPNLGRILFFDPTDDLAPLGFLRGDLQANYGLLLTPDGGEMLELPRLPSALNGTQRTAKFTLDAGGALTGEIHEVHRGDPASSEREALRDVTKDTDRIKRIETLLAHSLATFHIPKATVGNLELTELPLVFNYSVVAEDYAKRAGNLLLVRPRVVGNESAGFLETKEPRKYPVEFNGPFRDTDVFEITLPPGFELEDLPPPVALDFDFASYHSKAEADGQVLRYARSFELKELSVPLAKIEELKKLYRVIASDERNTAVLKPSVR